jgi:anti-anti-sigma factor
VWSHGGRASGHPPPETTEGVTVLSSSSASPARRLTAERTPTKSPVLSPPLRRTVRAESDAATVAPHGELDLATAPLLDADLRDLRDIGFRTLVVDLRGLTFIDSAGVHLLLRWATSAARRGDAFRVIPGPDRVHLVFAITGVLDALGLDEPRAA